MYIKDLLQDLVRGTHVRRTTSFLKTTDFWTRVQLDAYKLEKLKALIEYCYDHVPFYRSRMEQLNLRPSDFTALDDLVKLPIVTKEDVRIHHKEFLSDAVDYSSRKVLKAKTGGTTGMPLAFYKNTQTRDFAQGSMTRWYNWMGIDRFKDKKVILWGQKRVLDDAHSIKDKAKSTLSRTLDINSFNLKPDTLPDVVKKIIDFNPVFLRGYLSAIFQVAIYFRQENLSLPQLKAISSTTETLLPIYRDFIEETFGVKIFDQYGCGECNGISYECPAHQGLHITEEHCIVEILDEKGEPCLDKEGRIVITDLDNYAFPFIRYENGDSAAISSKECSCGRHSRLMTHLSGRTKDTVILKDGSEVHGVFFTDLFHELGFDNFEYFTRFQIYQEKKGAIVLRLEKTQTSLPEEKLSLIKETLRRFCDPVEIVMLDKLEHDASGKFRYIISGL